jgi:hypothetical protein
MQRFLRVLSVCTLIAAAALVLSGVATPADARAIRGTVVAIDGTSLVIRAVDGTEEHLTLASGVTTPADVRVGSDVEVTVGDMEGSTTVSMVALVPAESESPSSAAQDPAASDGPDAYRAASDADDIYGSDLPATAGPAWTYGILGLLALAGSVTAGARAARRR